MSEAKAAINLDGLQALIGALDARGYKVLGPTVRDGAIVYDEIAGVADLPAGWTDRQDAGRYRLEHRDDGALFGFAHGPQSWKRFLHPPMQTLWTAKKNGDELEIVPPEKPSQKFAFIGARSCELHAIAIQDKVFRGGPYVDAGYSARRRDAFIVAVNCGEAGGTCFCVSMKTGPKAESGFDLALTELLDGSGHSFLVEAGSEAGAALLEQLPKRPATEADLAAAKAWSSARRATWDAVLIRTASRRFCKTTRNIRAGRMRRSAASHAAIARWFARPVSARPSTITATSPARQPAGCANGTPASPWTSPIFTAAPCGKAAAPATGNG